MKPYILTVATMFAITGCTSLSGRPDQGLLEHQARDVLKAFQTGVKYDDGTGTLITAIPTEAYFDTSDPDEKKRIMLDYWGAHKGYYDAKYGRFESRLRSQGISSNLALDIAQIGVGAAGTIFTGGASQALSAASTGLAGTQTAFNQRLFEAQTVNALITQMRANRIRINATINENMKDAPDSYTLGNLQADLEQYFYAGTIASATAELAANASRDEEKALNADAESRQDPDNKIDAELFNR